MRLRFVDTAAHHLALYLALFGIVPTIVIGVVKLAPARNPDAFGDVIRGLGVVSTASGPLRSVAFEDRC